MKIKFFIILIITPIVLYSQTNGIKDSLIQVYENSDDYKEKSDILYKISNEMMYKNTDSARIYADECLLFSETYNYSKGIALSYLLYGTIYNLKGNFTIAVNYFMKAISIFEELKDEEYMGIAFYKLAISYFEMQEYKTALKYNILSFHLLEKVNSPEVMYVYGNTGLVYSEMNNIDSAMTFFNLSITEGQKNNNESVLLYAFANIANLYFKKNDFPKSIEVYEKVKQLSIKLGDKKSLTDSYLNISGALIQSSFTEKEEIKKQNAYKKALNYADSALILAQELKSSFYLSFAYKQLSNSYKALEDFKNALYYYELFFKTNDSLFTTEKVIELKSLGNEYQIEKQNIELANIKKSERKQKLINFIIIIAIVMITALMILLWFLYRRKLTVSRLLQEKNDDILKQRLKIAGQRDKLSELAFELKHTNKTKDKFFSVLAHDLKNPFQSLTGFSELLMQQIKNEDYSNALRYSEIIHETSYTTYILLENFLNWARVQTGVLKYNPEYLVLLEVVNESIEISKYTSDLKQIKIETIIEETVQIYADKYLITTTLRNLISNAVKFSNPGGVIFIDFQIEDNNYLSINVKDNGVGMKPQVLRNLFKISNYSALGTREEKGTGLGLIISKEFSILNKGDLFVTSEHGKGSTFSIKIPYHNNAN